MSPVVQVVSAALTAGTAIAAARQAQFVDIAAYSAGIGAVAFLGVVVGGGTSLIYVTGDDADRVAVRAVRWRLIAPVMTLLTIGLMGAYRQFAPDLPSISILLGGATVVLANLAGLEAATLQRNRRMGEWAVATVTSKALPLVAVGVGSNYSAAMAAGSVLALISYSALAGRVSSRRAGPRMPVRVAVRRAYRLSFSTIALLDVAMLRLPFVLAPVIAEAATAGAFSTLLSAQQSITALITTGLYTIMTVRGGRPVQVSQPLVHARSERLFVVSSIPIAVAGIALAGPSVAVFKIEQVPGASLLWILLMAAVVPLAINRAAQYRKMTFGRPVAAVRILGTVCATVIVVCIGAVWTGSIYVLAGAVLVGEAAGSAYVGISFLRTRRSTVRPERCSSRDRTLKGTAGTPITNQPDGVEGDQPQ